MPNDNQQELSAIILQETKMKLIGAVSAIMQENRIPAAIMEGIMSIVLADIRAQASADLIIDIRSQTIQKKEGDIIE